MMTEHEAWKWLADLWRTARPINDSSTDSFVGVQAPGRTFPFLGLCSCIDYLWDRDKITYDRCVRMTARVLAQRQGECSADGYNWPRDAAGAIARVEFCERMAKETEHLKENVDA